MEKIKHPGIEKNNKNTLSLAERRVVTEILTLFANEHVALPESQIAEVLRMLPAYRRNLAVEPARWIKTVLISPGLIENRMLNDKIVKAIADMVYHKEEILSGAIEAESNKNNINDKRESENEPKIVLYRDWLLALEKGISRNRVEKEAIKKTLVGVRDFSYSDRQADKTASEIIWAFKTPIEDVEKAANIDRFDILAKIAILLRDDLTNWKLAKRITDSIGGQFSTLFLELEKERFEEIKSLRTPEAEMNRIIKKFNELSDGVPERYGEYTLVFSEVAKKQFADYYKKHASSLKSEFNQLCESLPYLKTELLLRRVGRSPARGQLSVKQIIYKGRSYDAYHAGPNYINLRAEYIIAGKNTEKEIVITGFYIAHPTGNSSEGFR